MNREDIIRMAREAGFGSNSLGVTFTSRNSGARGVCEIYRARICKAI